MPRPSEFVEHVVEMLRAFGEVNPRAMFGGWGLYHEGLFFALIAQDTLYLKVDDDNRAAFEAERLPTFVYETRAGDKIPTSYRRAPDDALESRAVMAEWARLAYGAALRASKSRGPRKPRRKLEA